MPYFASCHKVRHKVMLDVQFICWCSQELYCSTGPVLSHPTLFSYARPGAFSSGTGQSTRDKTAACSANMCNVAGQARMTRTGRVQPLIRRGLRTSTDALPVIVPSWATVRRVVQVLVLIIVVAIIIIIIIRSYVQYTIII